LNIYPADFVSWIFFDQIHAQPFISYACISKKEKIVGGKQMTVFKTFKDFLGITQTKVGIVFSIFVPLVFLLFWMTGYHGATERVDQLVVGIVNEDGQQGERIAMLNLVMLFRILKLLLVAKKGNLTDLFFKIQM